MFFGKRGSFSAYDCMGIPLLHNLNIDLPVLMTQYFERRSFKFTISELNSQLGTRENQVGLDHFIISFLFLADYTKFLYFIY